MTDAIRHRGPDDSGIALLGPAALGQRRLSIIDLSPTGHQPMQTADGRFTLVYNGELYNFPELRRVLEAEGFRFRGSSDTEVVLNAFARWGTEAFRRFAGMFAVAVWDAFTRRLILARDRFGIKPLYFARAEQAIVFGSEIKALLASGRLTRRMSWPALHEFLYYGNALGKRTLFDGVARLLPAHYLAFDEGGFQDHCFWSVRDLPSVPDGLSEATSSVREHLEHAVQDHLISDVPVGVFLSGGIDSSAITAFASRHYDGQLSTYSVKFDFNQGIDELPKAALVARRFNTDHHELHIHPHNISAIIENLVRAHDEPFADPANIPLYLLCQELRGSVKVILQGDGGDEIFAGYRRYNVLAHERLWRGLSRVAVPIFAAWPPGPKRQRAMRFFETMNIADAALRMAMLMTVETQRLPPTRILSASARRQVMAYDPFQRYRELHERLADLDVVQRMLYIDSLVLLPDTFLEKVDKSTMAHGIEVRVPFLDNRLTDYAMALPSSLKVRHAQKKYILRRAMRGILPDEILDAPKTGLTVPVDYWLREPLKDYMMSVLLDASTMSWGIFDRGAVEDCIKEHLSGRRNNWYLLYKMLQLAIWRRFYLEAA